MPDTNATPDPTAFVAHFDTIYRPHLAELPAGARLSSNWQVAGGAGRFTSRLIDASNIERLTDQQLERAADSDTWISVAFISPDADERGRGKREDVIAVPALFVDVDTADGTHKAGSGTGDLPHPTREQAQAILATLPLQPTLLINTGGGFHAWYALESLLLPADLRFSKNDDGERIGKGILDRWKVMLLNAFDGAGHFIDRGVPADTARVLRMAGTVNHKPVAELDTEGDPAIVDGKKVMVPCQRPVEIVELHADRRYSLDFVENVLPYPEVTTSTKRTSRTALSIVKDATSSGKDESDRWNAAVHSAHIFEALGFRHVDTKPNGEITFDAPYLEGNAWGLDVTDLVEIPTARVCTYADGSFCAFGEGTAKRLHGKAGNGDKSFALLAGALCDGDFKVAAQLAVLSNYDARKAVELWLAADRDGVAAVAPEKWTDFVAPATTQPSMIEVGVDGHLLYTTDMPEPGLWAVKTIRTKTDKKEVDGSPIYDHEEVRTRKTNWYAYVSGEQLAVGVDGDTTLIGTDVTVVMRKDSKSPIRTWTARGLAEEDVTNLHVIMAKSHASVVIPGPAEKNLLAAAVRDLHPDRRTDTLHFSTTGWYDIDGATFVAPAGSVTASGIRHDINVDMPSGARNAGILSSIGWKKLSPDLRRDAKIFFDAFLDVASHDSLQLAILGAAFAAPLRLTNRTTLQIIADGGSGKTVDLGLAFSMLIGRFTNVFPISLLTGTVTGFSGVRVAEWMRDLFAPADDFKKNTGPRDVPMEVLERLVRGGYGGVIEVKGTRDQGVKFSNPMACIPIVTSEIAVDAPDANTTVQRIVPIYLKKGQIPLNGRTAVDVAKEVVNTGVAADLYASYMSFLAGEIDAVGGIVEFAMQMDAIHGAHRARLQNLRSGETVGVIATGLEMMRRWAAAEGFEDLLPTQAVIDAAIASMLGESVTAQNAFKLAERIREVITGMIASGQAYLEGQNGGRPASEDAENSGWRINQPRPNVPCIGRIYGGVIELLPTGLDDAFMRARQDGLARLATKQKASALVEEWGTDTAREAGGIIKTRGTYARTGCIAVMAKEFLGLTKDVKAVDADTPPDAPSATGTTETDETPSAPVVETPMAA